MKGVPSIPSTRHAGALPPWGIAPMPEAPPFTLPNIMRTVGPGVIGLGLAIGSGEWLLGPSIIVTYGAAFLWITTISVSLQVLLNLEMARYTLSTGEPIITGFMRTKPGPTFWGWVYVLLAFLQYGWPGWALASATATAALLLGRMPTADDSSFVLLLGYVTFGLCFATALAGKKVERTIEIAMWIMVGGIVVFLLALDLFTVSAENWKRVAVGFTNFGRLPEGADWVLLGAFAAYSGLGGIGNAFITNWMRDKGQGMSKTVGYIAGALGDKVTLKPQGNTFEVNETSLAHWRGWWRFTNVDQWALFAVGSIVGMGLTALLTLQFVPAGTTVSGWAVANLQAQAISAVHGPIFWYITSLCGFWVLFSTQLGVVDGVPRATTDVLWSGSPAIRRWRGGDPRAIYYLSLAAFALWGAIALNLAQPLTLVLISANMGGVVMVFLSFHTIVVNRTLLPRELRPPLWREIALVVTGLFYLTFVVLAFAGAIGR